MPRYRVTIDHPAGLLGITGDSYRVFLRVWAQLPDFTRGSTWTFVDSDGGLFVKGQAEPLGLSPKRQERRYRVLREARALQSLRRLGLPMPEVLAWGAEYRLGLPVRSFLVERRIPGAVDMEHFLANPARSGGERSMFFSRLGREVARMHEHGIAHRDLYLRNVLVVKSGENHEPVFIDCPRAERHRGRMRARFLWRADLYGFVRDALRKNVAFAEIRAFLDGTGTPDPDTVIHHAVRSVQLGRPRPARANLWLMFGI